MYIGLITSIILSPSSFPRLNNNKTRDFNGIVLSVAGEICNILLRCYLILFSLSSLNLIYVTAMDGINSRISLSIFISILFILLSVEAGIGYLSIYVFIIGSS